jgi:hypothetical protein
MVSHRSFYLALVLVVGYFAADAQSWQSLNGPIRPHEVVNIAIGWNANGQRIYAVDVDTMKVSTDGARTWSAIGASSFSQPLVVACDSANPSIAIVGRLGMEDGLWRTTNGGTSWTQVGPSPPYDLHPQRAVISTKNPDLAFLGTERAPDDDQTTLWRSSNAGLAWSGIDFFKNDAHTFVNDILSNPADANYVYLAGSTRDVVDDPYLAEEVESPLTKGFWRSSDAGVNWEAAGDLGSTENNLTALGISIYQGSTGFFAGCFRGRSTSARIYQSNDNGDSWDLSATLDGGMTQIRAIAVKPSNQQMIIAATNAGLFMTTNRGQSWGSNNTNVPDVAKNIYDFKFDFRSADTAYIATGASVYKGVYSSGAWSWTASVTGSNTLNTTAISVRSDTAFAVSSGWTGISKYSGGSWNLVSSIKKFAGYSASTSSSGGSKVYVGGKIGQTGVVYQTTDRGTSWTEGFSSTAGTVVQSLLADEKSNSTWIWGGLAGTNIPANNIKRSTNSGSSWTGHQTCNSGAAVNSIAVNRSSGAGSSSTELYAGLDSYGVNKSTDGGSSWSCIGPNLHDIKSVALNSATSTLAQRVYIASPSYLWISTNSGTDWGTAFTVASGGAKKLLMHPSYSTTANFIWMITADGQAIYESSNGGSNWTEVSTSSLPKPLNDLQRDIADNAKIYVATSAGVYKVDPAPQTPAGIVGSGSPGDHPRITWSGNTEADLAYYIIYRTPCGIAQYDSIATVSKDSTGFTDVAKTISGGGEGEIRYKVKAKDNAGGFSGLSSSVGFACTQRQDKSAGSETEMPTIIALRPNYPNPFNPSTEIRFDLPEPAMVSLIVYDLLGRKVADLVSGRYEAGYHSAVWNASDMASGVYLARFNVVNELGNAVYTKTNKLVLMK